MNSKCILIIGLALLQIVSSRLLDRHISLGAEIEPEVKVREKRKYENPVLKHLVESGVGVRKSLAEENDKDETKIEIIESAKESTSGGLKGDDGVEKAGAAAAEDGTSTRVKKQTTNNVCIKVGPCGKTACGPIVSARGPVVSDMRMMLHGGKPIGPLNDLHPSAMTEAAETVPKTDRYNPVQARTIDTLMGIAPLPVAGVGYGTPAVYTGPSTAEASYGHSFFRPQTVQTVPVAVISQHPSHSVVHPWLMPHIMPHLMPHIMPHLMSGFGSYFTPHRFEPQQFPEVVQNDVKQPIPAYPQPSFVNADNTLVCQPLRTQKSENPFGYIYKPDIALDKSLNVTEESKKAYGGAEEERNIREHLRKVNEIREEIGKLSRAAQRIVDQQEKLTEMHHKNLLNGQPGPLPVAPTGYRGSEHLTNYMGSGYYPHPGLPWGYSRSNILSYPHSHDDVDFFVNLLRAGKKIGVISDSFQPQVAPSTEDPVKGTQNMGKIQKDSKKDTIETSKTA